MFGLSQGARRSWQKYVSLDRPALLSEADCADCQCPRLILRRLQLHKDLAVGRAPRAPQPKYPRCPFGSQADGEKALPQSGCGRYYLYKQRGRFSQFGKRERAQSKPRVELIQVNFALEYRQGRRGTAADGPGGPSLPREN